MCKQLLHALVLLSSIPQGSFELPELKYRNNSKHQLAVTNLNNLCFLNEPELLTALRTRYQKNILSSYVGQVLVHINPLRAGMALEDGGGAGAEGDNVLQQFALDVKNHATMAPEMWDAALAHLHARVRRGSLDGQTTSAVAVGGVLGMLKEAHQEAAEGDDHGKKR